MHLQFIQSESTFAYFNATQRYLEQHGKPVTDGPLTHMILFALDAAYLIIRL